MTDFLITSLLFVAVAVGCYLIGRTFIKEETERKRKDK